MSLSSNPRFLGNWLGKKQLSPPVGMGAGRQGGDIWFRQFGYMRFWCTIWLYNYTIWVYTILVYNLACANLVYNVGAQLYNLNAPLYNLGAPLYNWPVQLYN